MAQQTKANTAAGKYPNKESSTMQSKNLGGESIASANLVLKEGEPLSFAPNAMGALPVVEAKAG